MDTHALVPATECPLRARLLVLGVVLTVVVIIVITGVPERHTCWCTLQDAQVPEDLFCTRVLAHKSASISEPRPRDFLIAHSECCLRQRIQHQCYPASLGCGTLDTRRRGCSRAPPPSRLECSPPRSVLQLHHEYCNHRLILACRSYPLSSLVQVLNVSRHFPLTC